MIKEHEYLKITPLEENNGIQQYSICDKDNIEIVFHTFGINFEETYVKTDKKAEQYLKDWLKVKTNKEFIQNHYA